ncbi:MAG TPA: hypothetical protein VJ781_01825, partial [Pyrinomonadaceae bacterium]|nr:hypothetical protein [Pyrinomonadaceae bacterium]
PSVLLNPSKRLDLVLTRGAISFSDIDVVGEDIADLTPSGFRPSDHAEVLGPEPRDHVADEQNRHTRIEARAPEASGWPGPDVQRCFIHEGGLQYRATAPHGQSLSNRAHR